MTRINALRSNAGTRSVAWGKRFATGAMGDINAYVFAAVLIICSVAVGCSSDKPKPVTSNNQIPAPQAQAAMPETPAPVMQAEKKPAPKKVVRKKPATVNYADKSYGVTFEYPRRYAIETGDAAMALLSNNPIAMNFVQPGGVALAAVELPETNYTNTDFSSAFFNVSVNKTLSADQCSEFAVPQQKVTPEVPAATSTSTEVAKQDAVKTDAAHTDSSASASTSASAQTASNDQTVAKSSTDSNTKSKLMIGDMELRATEAVSGEGTRQSDSKYFHVYQNGACYEFALNVTTDASEEGLVKHVDRDKVFTRLEQILATVKINPVTPEVTAEAPVPAAPQTPVQ
jgi:hypothetical protein